MKPRKAPVAMALATVFAITACGSAPGPAVSGGPAGTTTVSFGMTSPDMLWGNINAAEQRFWPGLGIKAELVPTQGSSQTARAVASGTQNAGATTFDAAAGVIAAGQPVQVVAILMQRSPNSISVPTASGITSLKQLEGRTLGHYTSGSNARIWNYVLPKAGVDLSKVRQVAVNYGADLQLIRSGEIDGMQTYIGSQDLKLQCTPDPIPLTQFRLVEQGVNLYGQVLVVNRDWAEKVGKDVVRNLVLGFVQGATLVATQPEAVFDMVKTASGVPLPRDQQLMEATVVVPYLWGKSTPVVQEHGFGWADMPAVTEMLTLMHDLEIVDKQLSAEQVVTNEYLNDPAVHAAAMEYATAPQASPPADVQAACGAPPKLEG